MSLVFTTLSGSYFNGSTEFSSESRYVKSDLFIESYAIRSAQDALMQKLDNIIQRLWALDTVFFKLFRAYYNKALKKFMHVHVE